MATLDVDWFYFFDTGWLFGMCNGFQGSFPSEFVTPILGEATEEAVNQAKLLIQKKAKRAQDERRKQRAADRRAGGVQRRDSLTSQVDPIESELSSGKYSMLEFAMQYFRHGQERYAKTLYMYLKRSSCIYLPTCDVRVVLHFLISVYI